MVSCPNCGEEIDDLPAGDACPKCGRKRSGVVEGVAVLDVVGLVDVASTSVGYGSHRPWQQKWRDILDALGQVDRAYAERDMNNEDVRRVVEGFFKSCREQADWLWEDKQNANVSKQTVMNFVMNDGALSVCDGMANTIKHHTRKPTTLNPDPVTARIAAVSGGSGVRAEIEWSRPSGVSGSDDALDLARRCVAAWESFFQMHTLDRIAL